MRLVIMLGAFVGSVIGGLIPGLWGAQGLSSAALLLSFAGMVAGGLVGVKAGRLLS